ncbi:uncharacterized protein [Argopecten irradians]|uniref:uncharacterized protein n=1 Tax=Argopecten irradians TaxID=31199 RepID=UPI0037217581
MKVAVALLCFCVAVAVSQTTLKPAGSVALNGVCSHQSDCAKDLCCVHGGFGIGKKKRFFLDGTGGTIFGNDHDHGVCHPARVLNETCMPFLSHDIFNHELYQTYCPCEQGLECRGEQVDEGPHSISHKNPKCQAQE